MLRMQIAALIEAADNLRRAALITTEYYVRPSPAGNWWYEVAKFEGRSKPASVYYVSNEYCTCPAATSCKHVELVKEFKRLKEPWLTVFWQLDGKWQWYEVLGHAEPEIFDDGSAVAPPNSRRPKRTKPRRRANKAG